MSQKLPYFNQTLSKAYQEIEPALQARKLFLNNLSEDIKILEKQLSEVVCPLGIAIEYKQYYQCDVATSDADFDEVYNRVWYGTLTEVSQRILWDKASTGNPRLLHATTKKHFNIFSKLGGHPAIDVWREIDKQESEPTRPLIECSADVRIDVADYLPKLLTFIGDTLNNNSKELIKTIGSENSSWVDRWKEEASIWHTLPEETECPF